MVTDIVIGILIPLCVSIYLKKKYNAKFKTFFVCRTNCVEVADTILASLGTKVINLEGVLSPGTYYSYLEKEYLKKNSRIFSKTVYTKDLIKKKKY